MRLHVVGLPTEVPCKHCMVVPLFLTVASMGTIVGLPKTTVMFRPFPRSISLASKRMSPREGDWIFIVGSLPVQGHVKLIVVPGLAR